MVLGDHDGCGFPVTSSPIDKGAFIDNKPDTISSSIGVVFDLRWARLVVVYAAVPCHRAHDYTICKRKLPANGDGLQKAGHGGRAVIGERFKYESRDQNQEIDV